MFPDPLTDFPVLPMVMVRAVPQLAVVIFAPPLKEVPLMVRAVVRVLALVAVVAVAAFPLIFIVLVYVDAVVYPDGKDVTVVFFSVSAIELLA